MRKVFGIMLLFVAAAGAAHASGALGGYDAGAMNKEYVQDMRLHEVISRERQKNDSIIKPAQNKQLPKEVVASELKTVVFSGNDSIPSSELEALVSDKTGKPMTVENIAAVRKAVMKYYQDKGYFSAVAQVKTEDSQNGELTIEIKEGGKNSIQIVP